MALSKPLICSLVAASIAAGAQCAAADTLTLGYFKRPGFSEMVDGKPSGAFLVVAVAAVTAAALQAEWPSLPQKRLIDQVQQDTPNYCAVGIYKNADRLKFGKFSDPIYRDQRFIVLSSAANGDAIKAHASLMELLGDPKYKLGVIAGYSYGVEIDAKVKTMTTNLDSAVVTPDKLVAKVAAGRIDYVLAAPEDLEITEKAAGTKPEELARTVFADVPEGANRHFMCSKSVDDATIVKLNTAIGSLHLNLQ